jgi:regulator of protease activity HflC (stomatin/prohibitin superfamily)
MDGTVGSFIGTGQFWTVIGIIALLFLFFRMFRTVAEYERLVVYTLGRVLPGIGVRGPGLVIIVPFIETATKVDQRETFLDIPPQTAITKDNAPISIDFLVYYRITDPELSVIKVDNVVNASTSIAMTNLRAVIGDIELDGVLSKREQINDILRVKLDEVTDRWGLKITSVEIKEVEPPKAIQDAMNRQMSAERERRAEIITANGARDAAITRAQGMKQAAILEAQGKKESAILEAEGFRESEALRAQGYAAALKAIYEEAKKLDDKTMMLQYFQMLQKVGQSDSTKFVLPMELTSMMQRFSRNITDLDAVTPLPQKNKNGSE